MHSSEAGQEVDAEFCFISISIIYKGVFYHAVRTDDMGPMDLFFSEGRSAKDFHRP
jgi:hypothetical protein